ncbi:MAG: DNA-binding transcriptional MerR regulator [Myxococcota bacterium]|jgi:DNA-binding transcriptional MerR regulator
MAKKPGGSSKSMNVGSTPAADPLKPAGASATPAPFDANTSQEERVASLLPEGVIPEDGKLYYRIGEVSKITGVKPYVLRYWESEFRWMAPQKSRSKQRLYRRKDIEMILLIQQLLHAQRYTIAGARKHLRELGIGKALEAAAVESAREAAEFAANQTFSSGDSEDAFNNIRSELLAIREML